MEQKIKKLGFIKTAIIIAITLAVFYGIDFATKTVWFDEAKAVSNANLMTNDIIDHDWTVIGIRSYAHYNSTLFSSLKINMPDWAHHLMAFGLSAMIIAMAFLNRRTKLLVVGFSILLAGILGNGIDRLFHGYVMDIFFTPFHDTGTYNFADVTMVIGGIVVFIGLIREWWIFEHLAKKRNIELMKKDLMDEKAKPVKKVKQI